MKPLAPLPRSHPVVPPPVTSIAVRPVPYQQAPGQLGPAKRFLDFNLIASSITGLAGKYVVAKIPTTSAHNLAIPRLDKSHENHGSRLGDGFTFRDPMANDIGGHSGGAGNGGGGGNGGTGAGAPPENPENGDGNAASGQRQLIVFRRNPGQHPTSDLFWIISRHDKDHRHPPRDEDVIDVNAQPVPPQQPPPNEPPKKPPGQENPGGLIKVDFGKEDEPSRGQSPVTRGSWMSAPRSIDEPTLGMVLWTAAGLAACATFVPQLITGAIAFNLGVAAPVIYGDMAEHRLRLRLLAEDERVADRDARFHEAIERLSKLPPKTGNEPGGVIIPEPQAPNQSRRAAPAPVGVG